MARKIARDLNTGGVFINVVTASDPRVPVGGVKNSGYGRELSHFGLHAFVNPQTVWNLTPEAANKLAASGAKAATPREAAEGNDFTDYPTLTTIISDPETEAAPQQVHF